MTPLGNNKYLLCLVGYFQKLIEAKVGEYRSYQNDSNISIDFLIQCRPLQDLVFHVFLLYVRDRVS